MKSHVWSALAVGMALGGAAALSLAAMDPAIRRRMCRKARCIGGKAMCFCENIMK